MALGPWHYLPGGPPILVATMCMHFSSSSSCSSNCSSSTCSNITCNSSSCLWEEGWAAQAKETAAARRDLRGEATSLVLCVSLRLLLLQLLLLFDHLFMKTFSSRSLLPR